VAVKKDQPVEETTIEGTDRQVPEAEKPIESAETIETETVTPEKAVETPVEETTEISETEKQKQALIQQRLEIKRLKEELAKKGASSSINELRPPTVGQIPKMPRPEEFLDTEGRIDMVRFNHASQRWSESQAYQVKASNDDTKFQVMETLVKSKDPRLDEKSEKFDPVFEKRVADRYARLLLESYTKGTPEPSLMDVHGEVNKEFQSKAKESPEKVAAKEQAASISTSPSSNRAKALAGSEDLDDLRMKTRKGDIDALVTRLQAIKE